MTYHSIKNIYFELQFSCDKVSLDFFCPPFSVGLVHSRPTHFDSRAGLRGRILLEGQE